MLVSPEFLFRIEQDPADAAQPGKAYRISDVELASRLSFFLWSSIPDDELLDLAEQGKLKDPAVLEQQVRRMLDDPRADALVSNFAGQWLQLRNVETVKPDPVIFPFDEALRQSFLHETALFVVEHLPRRPQPARSAVGRLHFVNQRLAEHYGIPRVYGSQFRRVTLTDANRARAARAGQHADGDVLSQPHLGGAAGQMGSREPARHAAAAAAARRARAEGGAARQAAVDARADAGASRQPDLRRLPRAAWIRSDSRWRTTTASGVARRRRRRADRRQRQAARRHGVSRARPGSTKLLLTKYRDDFVRTATEKLLTYALGRGVEYYDYPAIRAIDRDAARDNYRISSLILAIVKSTPFQMRRGVGVMSTSNKPCPGERFCAASAPRWRCRCSTRWCRAVVRRRPASQPPIRLGYVYTPNGIIGACDKSPRPFMWTPKTAGANFEFSPTMKALEPFRDQINVFSGLAQVTGRALGDGPGDHARATATFLTGVHPYKTGGADFQLGISADQIAAKELGKYTQLSSLELGLEPQPLAGNCDSGYTCAYMSMSWRGPTSPLPAEINPRAVFERLFGDGDSTDAAARLARLEQQKSVLDYVTGSLSRLRMTGLATGDKRKLEEYLEAVRDIERRIQLAEEQNATMQLPHIERPSAIPDDYEQYTKLMIDMQVVAWQTDMTRVASFMLGRDGSNRAYREIGISDGHHSISHHQSDPEKVEKLIKIDELHVAMFAYLLEKLKDDARRRRHAARSLAGAVRQQHQRIEHPHARRSADRAGGRRERTAEGQPPSRLSEGNAAEQPVPEHVRPGGRCRTSKGSATAPAG